MPELFPIRKAQIIVEEVDHDLATTPDSPVWRGAALAVVANPYAGEYAEDFSPASDDLRELGGMLVGRIASTATARARSSVRLARSSTARSGTSQAGPACAALSVREK